MNSQCANSQGNNQFDTQTHCLVTVNTVYHAVVAPEKLRDLGFFTYPER